MSSEQILELMLNPKGTVGMVCFLLILSGLFTLRNLDKESPLAPYILQILGLTFILPVVILITTIIEVDGQAIMGLLGTIVGYIFGTSRNQDTVRAQNRNTEGDPSNKQIQATPKKSAPD